MRWALGLVALIGAAFIFALIIVNSVDAAHADQIEACARLGGEIVHRGYRFLLPDGLIVDPVLWEQSQ